MSLYRAGAIAFTFFTTGIVYAQSLRVFSEFTRFDGNGAILPQDRGATPRHILSPGLARNAHGSFRIVVAFAKPESFTLDVGQNPENAVQVRTYREEGEKLTPVNLPHDSHGAGTITYWMDIWVGAKAEVDRIKVEPQLYVESLDEWYTYPMEVRILPPVAPSIRFTAGSLPPASAPADHATHSALREALCGAAPPPRTPGAPVTAVGMIRRNTVEHLALADAYRKETGKDILRDAFLKASGESVESWCRAPRTPRRGPEWYLRFRDLIFRAWPGEPD